MSKNQLLNLSPNAKKIIVGGLYEHYKGLIYKVLGVARDSETLEELVVYQAQYGDRNIWVRPIEMFLENITIDAQIKPRFRLIENFL